MCLKTCLVIFNHEIIPRNFVFRPLLLGI